MFCCVTQKTAYEMRIRDGSSDVCSTDLWNSYHRCPTQELVDAFPMVNGKAIDDPTSGYDPANPYEGRDPRFYYSIIYNGSLYFNRNGRAMKPVWTYEGASPDGIVPVSSGGATHTGYYYRKMSDEQIGRAHV